MSAETPGTDHDDTEAASGRVWARPLRPYPDDAPLVAVHEAAWAEASEAECEVPHLQDVVANLSAYVDRLPTKIADYLLTHVGGDESQPWQAGHNYAMREAARLVRERWFEEADRD